MQFVTFILRGTPTLIFIFLRYHYILLSIPSTTKNIQGGPLRIRPCSRKQQQAILYIARLKGPLRGSFPIFAGRVRVSIKFVHAHNI